MFVISVMKKEDISEALALIEALYLEIRNQTGSGAGVERYDGNAWRSQLEKSITLQGVEVFLARFSEHTGAFGIVIIEIRQTKEGISGYIPIAYVSPARRRQGVLTRLDEAAAAYCDRFDIARIRLSVLHCNVEANVAWKRIGYKETEQSGMSATLEKRISGMGSDRSGPLPETL